MKTKKTATININPSGIDWRKEDLILKTNSCVYRSSNGEILKEIYNKEKKEKFWANQSKYCITMEQNYYQRGTEVYNVDNKYLSFRQYRPIDYISARVTDFEKAIRQKIPMIKDAGVTDIVYGYYTGDCEEDNIYPIISKQVRLYKDKTVVAVYELEWKDGEKSYYCLHKDYIAKRLENNLCLCNMCFTSRRLLEPLKNAPRNIELLSQKVNVYDRKLDKNIKMTVPVLEEVYSETEIEEHRIPLPAKQGLKAFMPLYGGVLSPKIGEFNDMGRNDSVTVDGPMAFDDDTRNIINEFFGVFDETNFSYKRAFDDKYNRLNKVSKYRDINKGITNLAYLNKYITMTEKSIATNKKKSQEVDEIYRTLHFSEEKGGVIWERRDNLIICTQHFVNDDYQKRICNMAFIYDIKKGKSKLIEKRGEGKPVFKIASMKAISRNFKLGVRRTSWEVIRPPYEQSFVGDICNFQDLFKGTNVGWIMDNMRLLGDKYEILFESDYYRSTWSYKSKLSDNIKSKYVTNLVLGILVSTGIPLLEQLLKNKQFNLYFSALQSKICDTKKFVPIDGKQTWSAYSSEVLKIEYREKQKSLKKMLGLTMNQIKMVNDSIKIGASADKDNKAANYRYLIPNLRSMKKLLKIEDMSTIDEKTFMKIIETSQEKIIKRFSYYEIVDCCSYLLRRGTNDEIRILFDSLPLKSKIEFLSSFCQDMNSISIYSDYLRMRKQLKELQEREENKDEDIFDEGTYPIKVGKANKFIRFTPGMVDHSNNYYWRHTIDTEEDFKRYINVRYERNRGETQIELVKDDGVIVGAQIKMDAFGHMNYLHDEMAQWFALYQNKAEVEGFNKALIRVQPLEWEDKEGELCILAPKNPTEIRMEGKILSHCVASYVDPIIKGTENIMFIRRKDMKREPFFTVDVSPKGEIRQVHCYRNGNPTAEDIKRVYGETHREVYNTKADVVGFLSKWCKAMKGKIDAKSIKKSYGALCANR